MLCCVIRVRVSVRKPTNFNRPILKTYTDSSVNCETASVFFFFFVQEQQCRERKRESKCPSPRSSPVRKYVRVIKNIIVVTQIRAIRTQHDGNAGGIRRTRDGKRVELLSCGKGFKALHTNIRR